MRSQPTGHRRGLESRRGFTFRAFLVPSLLICLGGPLGGAQVLGTELPVPKISDLTRVDHDTPPSRQDAVTATYILKTSPHATLGDTYVIVTDQTDEAFLGPLQRLAEFHRGSIIRVDDLSALRTAAAERDQLISDLRRAKPRFVAIAPKSHSFNENMLLGIWSVLTALGDDQRLPVFPGILAAPDAAAFKSLVDRSIHYRPQSADQVRPFVMGQVLGPMPYGQRSLQKVHMMRNYFSGFGCQSHSLVILADTAVQMGVTVSYAPDQWQVAMSGPGQYVKAIPHDALPTLDKSSLLLMFGHGTPGTECSLDVGAFRNVTMTDEIVMSGDCFSAAPSESSFLPPPGAAGRSMGHANDESFAMLAVGNGADVVYAHMRENSGFPDLFPVLESWTDGQTVGEAYQRLINALIGLDGISPRDFSSDKNDAGRLPDAGTNDLLYVVIGDPALRPLAKMTP